MNIGLIGCGRAAERYYLPALASMKEARLVAAADPLRERRELFSSSLPGCAAYASAEALLADAPVAALIVATPPATHAAAAILALRAGIPVLVEKPLASSMAELRELAALAASTNGSLMVGFSRRYWLPIHRLRQILCDQYPLEASARLLITSNVEAWSPISGIGDPLDDLGPHQFDSLRFIFGREILSVQARRSDADTIRMRVRLSGGILAECEAAYRGVSQECITVKCDSQLYHMRVGSERLQPANGPVRSVLDFSDAVGRRLCGRLPSMHRSFEEQLAKFFHYVRSGTAPQPGLADGLAVTRAIEAARRSADKNGAEVEL